MMTWLMTVHAVVAVMTMIARVAAVTTMMIDHERGGAHVLTKTRMIDHARGHALMTRTKMLGQHVALPGSGSVFHRRSLQVERSLYSYC